MYAESREIGNRCGRRLFTLALAVVLGLSTALILAGSLVARTSQLQSGAYQIRARQVLPDGAFGGSSYPVSTGARDSRYPQIATNDVDETLIVWEQESGGSGGYDLYGSWRQLAASPFTLLEAEGDQYHPATAGDGAGGYIAAWQDNRSGHSDIYAQVVRGSATHAITVTQAAGDQTNPGVAYNPDDDEYLVVWEDARDGADNPDIYAQRVSGAGALVGDAFTVTTAPYRQVIPHVAYAPGQGVYLVAWRHYVGASDFYFDAYAQLVSNVGELVGEPLPISARTGDADRESPTDVIYNTSSNRFLVLWQDLRTGYWNVWGRHVSVTGTLESQIQITALATQHESGGVGAYNPDADQYLIAWWHRSTPNAAGDIRARRMTGSGVVMTTETLLIAAARADQPYFDVAHFPSAKGYVILWNVTGGDIYGRMLSTRGALGAVAPVARAAQNEQGPRMAADDAGGLLAIWQRDNGGDHKYDLYGAKLRVFTLHGPMVVAGGNQRQPAVAKDKAGSALIAWQDDRNGDWDVHAILFNPTHSLPITIAQAAGDQTNPGVAYNPDDDEYLVVWQDARDGADNPDIYAQRVSGAGVLVGDAFTVTTAPYRQVIPHVAYAPGQGVYLVAWRHYVGASDFYFDAYAQLVSNVGELVGEPLPISARTGDADRESPTDVIYNTGSDKFLVLWNDLRTGYWNVWGRHVSVTGTLESQIQITTLATQHENDGVGAYNPDADQYLIAWWHRSTPNAAGDIRARRMTGSGVVTTTETLLIAAGEANETSPDVIYLSTVGEYTVVWDDNRISYNIFLPLVLRSTH